jgi:hypothetical protein
VQRKAVNTYKAAAAAGRRCASTQLVAWFATDFSELEFAVKSRHGSRMKAPTRIARCGVALRGLGIHTPQGQHKYRAGVLFKIPRKLDFQRLVPVQTHRKRRRGHTLSHVRSAMASR